MARATYCPFCDLHNPTHTIVADGKNVLGIKNYAPRQPISNVFFPVPPFSTTGKKHISNLIDLSNSAWLSLLKAQIEYVKNNQSQFYQGDELTLRMVLNNGVAGRQSVEHLHWQLFSPAKESLGLGRFCTDTGFSLPNQSSSVDIIQTNSWLTMPCFFPVAPIDILFIPPKNFQGLLNCNSLSLIQLLQSLRSYICVNQSAFANGYRLVMNIGQAAGHVYSNLPIEIHLLAGKSDLGKYCEHPILPERARMDELDECLFARATELGQLFIPSWWKHVQQVTGIQ
jgi:diadenosine tetraphosphate (Ap4A) HIT family hydrolase